MNLKDKYHQEIQGQLKTDLGLKNVMAVPRLLKVVVSVALKEALTDKKILDTVSEQLTTITGQKPTIRKAKKSIAAFKLRLGEPVGMAVTLRGQRMYDFVEKLVGIVFPRVRDFHGISEKGFDGHGNYSVGFPEQIVFSEIDYGKIDKIRGLEVTIVTNAKDDTKGLALLKALGLPFRKNQNG